MKTKKKVCFIISTFNPGGTENYLLRFLKYSNNKFDVTIICKNKEGYKGILFKQFKELKISIIHQPLGYINIKFFLKVYFVLKRGHFDTVCDMTGNFGGIPMFMAKILSINNRIVFYRRSSNAFKQTKINLIYNYVINKLVYNNATKIFSNSQHALHFFFPYKNKNDKKFKIIYNGFNFNDYLIQESKDEIRDTLGIKKDVFLIGHVGRFDSAKNHNTIFKVANRLSNLDSSFEFLFCGTETDSEAFKKQISDFGLTKCTHLIGESKEVPKILKMLDLFYFPSLTEGQPNALIEAMLSNLPILTSNIASIKEIIPKDNHRQLLDPYDIESAVEAIILVKDNSEILKGHKLKNWAAERFNSEINFRIFEIEL